MNVNLELTDHCNIRCRMCSQSLREEAHGVPMRFMDFSTWRQALGGLEGMGEVDLCPHWLGEPTLHPQFGAFVEYAFAQNRNNRLFRSFKLHTNAVILPPERARLLLRMALSKAQRPDTFTAIHFSIDAFSAEGYRRVKGADHREKVYRNVERFLRIRQEEGGERPVAHIAFVVQEDNAAEAEAFLAHWGGILRALGRPFRVTAEWPPFDQDALYFRRLNAGDQQAADRLHREVARAVGAPVGERLSGSF